MENKNIKNTIIEVMKDYQSTDENIRRCAVKKIIELLSKDIHELIKKEYGKECEQDAESLYQVATVCVLENIDEYVPAESQPMKFFRPKIQMEINDYLKEMNDKQETEERTEDQTGEVNKKMTKKQMVQNRMIIIMEDYHSGDMERKRDASQNLIQDLTNYIYYIIINRYGEYAKKYREDLYQNAVVHVLENMGKYNPRMAMPTTFFTPYIKHGINDFLTTAVHKTTSHYNYNILKIKKFIDNCEKRNIFDYKNTDIANETGLQLETINNCMEIIKNSNVASLDELSNQDFEMQCSQRELSPEDHFFKNNGTEVILSEIAKLSDEERYIVIHYYGFDGERETYKKIADDMDLPVDKVRRMGQTCIKKLKQSSVMRNTFNDNMVKKEKELLDKEELCFISKKISNDEIDTFFSAEMDDSDEFLFQKQ